MANERNAPGSNDGSAAAAFKQVKGVAVAIASSLLMYVVVVEILTRTTPVSAPPAFFQTLRIALFVLAGAIIFITTLVKAFMLREAPSDEAGRLARLRTATIVGLALSEVPVASGLVLVILGRARPDFYMLLAISAYMMVRHFPRRGVWDEYLLRGRTTVVR